MIDELLALADRRRRAVSVADVVRPDEQVDVEASPSLLVADPAFERRVLDGQGVEHRRHRRQLVRRQANADLDDRGTGDELAELRGHADADVHHRQTTIGAARTDSTGGRCWASSRHESPSSVDA